MAESNKLNPPPLDEGPRWKKSQIEAKSTWHHFGGKNNWFEQKKKKKNLNTRAHDLKNPWPCTNVCFSKTNIAHIPKRIKLTIAMHNRIRAWCPSFKQFTTFLKHGHLAKLCNYMAFCEWNEHIPNDFGFMLLRTTNFFFINWWKKKKIWFLKNYIPFEWKYWNLNWIELNSNSTKFNLIIRLRFNWKEMNANWWRRYWKYGHEYDVGK